MSACPRVACFGSSSLRGTTVGTVAGGWASYTMNYQPIPVDSYVGH
jgi:hypothetical protein